MSAPLTRDGGRSRHRPRPIESVLAYVLDSALRPCPMGTVGELYIGGEALAQCYIGQPALTAQRFIADPFASAPGRRLYRTGDLAAWRADGQLEFRGGAPTSRSRFAARACVEPGEVAVAIAAMPLVEQVAVDAAPNAEGRMALTAYVVPSKHGDAMLALRRASVLDHVEAWREIEDDVVVRGEAVDPTFDTRGWNSAYTGEPLSSAEMRDYVEGTVARIGKLVPRRLLEIGCGAGLIHLPAARHARGLCRRRCLKAADRAPAIRAGYVADGRYSAGTDAGRVPLRGGA